jgi:hypothetical protein
MCRAIEHPRAPDIEEDIALANTRGPDEGQEGQVETIQGCILAPAVSLGRPILTLVLVHEPFQTAILEEISVSDIQ